MKNLKEDIIEAVQDATDSETGQVSISVLAAMLDDILTEEAPEDNHGEPCGGCGGKIFTHRHSNWIECINCNKIKVLS